MKDIRVTVMGRDCFKSVTGEGVMVMAFSEEEENITANCLTHGDFTMPDVNGLVIEYICELLSDRVTQKKISYLDGIEEISDMENKLNEMKRKLSKRWADMAAKDSEFDIEKFKQDAGQRIVEIATAPLSYADESEHDDFGDETDNAGFTS